MQTVLICLLTGGFDAENLFASLQKLGMEVACFHVANLQQTAAYDLVVCFGLPPGDEKDARDYARRVRSLVGKRTRLLFVTSWDSSEVPIHHYLKLDADAEYIYRASRPEDILTKVLGMLQNKTAG